MKMKKLTPNLMVQNVNHTIRFYEEILGFEFVMSKPEEGQFNWAMMKFGDVEIMFQTRASLAEEIPDFKELKIGGSLTFFIEVEGIKEFYAKIKQKATIAQDLHTTFYGMQEFAIKDLDGYILTFAESAD